MLKKTILFFALVAAPLASANEELKSVLRDIQFATWNGQYEKLAKKDQETVTAQLLNVRDLLFGRAPASVKKYICAKGPGGGWVVTALPKGTPVGGEHDFQNRCNETLPAPGAAYACILNAQDEYALYALETERFIGGGSMFYRQCAESLPKN